MTLWSVDCISKRVNASLLRSVFVCECIILTIMFMIIVFAITFDNNTTTTTTTTTTIIITNFIFFRKETIEWFSWSKLPIVKVYWVSGVYQTGSTFNHLTPPISRLRMSGSVHTRPLYAFLVWIETARLWQLAYFLLCLPYINVCVCVCVCVCVSGRWGITSKFATSPYLLLLTRKQYFCTQFVIMLMIQYTIIQNCGCRGY